MKFFRMLMVNCKKYFKDYKSIIWMFLIPIVCVSLTNFFVGDTKKAQSQDLKVAFINLDKGKLGDRFIKDLNINTTYSDREEALKSLKNYSVIALYEIPEDFTENINKNIKPTIIAYKLEDGNKTNLLEAQMEERLNRLLSIKILQDNKIIEYEEELDRNIVGVDYKLEKGILSSEESGPIMLLLFFVLTFSTNVGIDLLKLRKERILERFLSTNNRGYEIMGSIYLSMVISQVGMYTASFVVMKLMFKFQFGNFGMLVLNIALMSLISISLGIMVTRIFKDQGVSSIVLSIISIGMFFIYSAGVVGESSTKVPKLLVTLSKFSPLYWAMGSIEKSVIFPNSIILILMALAFFSAGSIRYSHFAKKVS